MLIKKTRNLLRWLKSSMFSRIKYRNIRQQLQERVPAIFGKVSIFKHKDVLLNAATLRYFRFYKRRGQHVTFDDKPPDKFNKLFLPLEATSKIIKLL